MTGSWYNSGFDGMGAEQQRLESQYGPPRFWLPIGQSREIVFMDDEPFCIHEHNPYMGGNYQNWITCVQGIHDDAVCCQKLEPKSRYYIGYLTICDTSVYTDKKGNEHQFEMKMIGGKLPTMKAWKRKKDDRATLIGQLYKVSRDSDKAPSCGGEFEFNRSVDMEKLFTLACYKGKKLSDLFTEAEANAEKMVSLQKTFQLRLVDGKLPRVLPAFNYVELLKPLTPKELRIKLAGAEPRSSTGKGKTAGAGAESDDVPF